MSTTNFTWEYENPKEFEHFSTQSCIRFAKTLDPDLSDSKLAENAECIYMCLNTWFCLMDDLGQVKLRKFLRTYVREVCKNNISHLLTKVEEVAKAWLPTMVGRSLPNDTIVNNDAFIKDHNGRCRLLPVYATYKPTIESSRTFLTQYWPEFSGCIVWDEQCHEDILVDILCILRFPKRLSPIYSPSKSEASLTNFFKVDNESMCSDQSSTADRFKYPSDDFEDKHHYLISWLRDIFAELEYPDTDTYRAWFNHYATAVPNGATMDTCNNPLCKRLSASAHMGNSSNPYTPHVGKVKKFQLPKFVDRVYIANNLSMQKVDCGTYYDPRAKKPRVLYMTQFVDHFLHVEGGNDLPIVVVRPQVVPKSFSEGRVIAPCPIMHYKLFRPIARALESIMLPSISENWHGSIDLHNQSWNQWCALMGSIDGSYATIDASGASDRIKKRVQLCVMPTDYCRIINHCEMYLMDNKGSLKLCHMVATSGNPFTFINESGFYAGVTELSYRIYELYFMADDEQQLLPFSVYGDDVACDSRVVELLRQLYTIFGLKFNDSKSYSGEQWYRESCGGEYLLGNIVTPLYFPRKPWENLDDRLYSMNNAIHRYMCDRGIMDSSAVAFLRHHIRTLYPKASFLPEDLTDHGLLGEQVVYDVRKLRSGTVDFQDDIRVESKYPSSEFQIHRFVPYETVLTATYEAPEYGKCKTCACRLLSWEDFHQWAIHDAYEEFLEHGPIYDEKIRSVTGVEVSTPQDTLDHRLAHSSLRFRQV